MSIGKRANCWAHLINNVVHEMVKDSEAKQIVSDAAKLVKYIKKAGLNHHFNFTLKSYCETRWSTVYTMLDSILKNYETIYNVLEQRSKDEKSHRDCLKHIECIPKSTIIEMVNLLKPFKDWTDIIEADKRITIHKVWPIYIKMSEHLAPTHEDDVGVISSKNFTLIEAMKVFGRNYIRDKQSDFEPTIEQKMAVALHPRFKKLRKMGDDAREKTYASIDSLISNGGMPPKQMVEKSNAKNSQNLFEEFAESEDEDNANSDQLEYCHELNEYMRMPSPSNSEFLNTDDSDALAEWWYKNKSIFPNLFKLFMQISAIPASSASSERCFSVTGLILSDRRSCLLPKNVSNLVVCRNHVSK